jgi:DNA-binding CsgD family transcriptional regulator/class 3 adenylate cyclase
LVAGWFGDRKVTVNSKRSVVTVLTAELLSALRISARLGDVRWAELHCAHETEVDAILQRWDGRTVWQSATTLTAVFASASHAVSAGKAILDISQNLELPARIGLHRTEALTTGAGRVYGAGLLISGLIGALGRSGDLLVSQTVIDALPETGPSRLVGRWEFEGSSQGWSVYSLGERAAEGEFSLPAGEDSPALSALTRRQTEIALLLAAGMSNREIAGKLSISEATVERHISNMLLKLPFRTRSQIAAWVIQQRGPQ